MLPALSPVSRYTTTAIAMHWVSAIVVATLLAWGWFMSGLPFSPQRIRFVNWHKWAGIVLLSLTLVRLLWRLLHQPPPLPPEVAKSMPGWQHLVARRMHGLLYVLLLLVPLLGWAYSSAAGFPVVVFGVIRLPDLLLPDKDVAAQLKLLHAICAYLLATLAALHVAAALKHHWLDKDRLLQRMWPAASLPASHRNRESP